MNRYLPSVFWAAALTALYFMNTASGTSLCLSKLSGFGECWGCGIGHSIHHTLHLNLAEAAHMHWLGIPSTIGLMWLILKPFFTKHTPYEPTTTFDASRHTSR